MNPIDWEDAMRQVGDDLEFLDEVVHDLLTEADTAQEEMSEGISQEDFKMIRSAAHRIKGSASYLCCTPLKTLSHTIQDLCDVVLKDASTGRTQMPLIVAEYKEYVVALKDLVVAVNAKFPPKGK